MVFKVAEVDCCSRFNKGFRREKERKVGGWEGWSMEIQNGRMKLCFVVNGGSRSREDQKGRS